MVIYIKILSLDTSAQVAAAAICEDDTLIIKSSIDNGNTHSQTLLPMIESMLSMTGISLDDIDVFAASEGPGSFTGVRIGISTVKGLAFGRNKPCIGVSTLEALAINLAGFDGIICPVMNARRSQVYTATFSCRSGKLERLTPDRAISIAELDDELSAKIESGEYPAPIYFCGDGYDITLESLRKTVAAETPQNLIKQDGYSVAKAALRLYREGVRTSDCELSPVYLRPCQAERERNERLKNEK